MQSTAAHSPLRTPSSSWFSVVVTRSSWNNPHDYKSLYEKNFPGEQHLLSGGNSDSKELFGRRIQSVSHEEDDSVIHIGKEKHSAGLPNVILETHYMHYCVLLWSSWHRAVWMASGSHSPVSSSRRDPKPPSVPGLHTNPPSPATPQSSTCGSHFSQLGWSRARVWQQGQYELFCPWQDSPHTYPFTGK